MKKVLVQLSDNRLCDIVPAGQEFSVAAGLQWVDAPDDVAHDTHRFANGAVEAIPPKPLSDAKLDKLFELERARKVAVDTLPPVTVANKQYPATPEYREIVTGIARRQAAGRPIPATLRGADGTPATLNTALISQIDDAITGAVQAAWDRYWQRWDAVQAATTVEQVDAVAW